MKKLGFLLAVVFILGGCAGRNALAPSNLSYLQKVQDGVIFSEDFENANWLSAQGWKSLQGTPTTTNSIAEDGVFSFQCTGAGSTLSQIQKTLSSQAGYISVFLFDDGTTTGEGPYVKVKLSDGNYMSFGIRNNIDTSHYCYGLAGSGTDAPTTADTYWNRSLGWVHIVFQYVAGTGWQAQITLPNGFTVDYLIGASETALCTDVFLMSGSSSDTGSAFGYFDSLKACGNEGIAVIKNLGTSVVQIYDSSNTLIDAPYVSGGVAQFSFTDFLKPIPISVYVEISDPATTTKIQFRSPLMQVNPGDIYIYHSVNFGRKLTSWQPTEKDLMNQNQSSAGVTETLFNGYKAEHVFSVTQLQGMALKKQLNNFYAYAAQGFPFSVLIDPGVGYGWGVLAAAPTVGAQSVTVMPTLSTNPNDNFTVGRTYRIFDGGGQLKQTVTLASKTSTTQLNFNEYITQAFQQGDYICDDTFQPFLEAYNFPDGFRMKDARYLYFDWNQQCRFFTSA